jgi:dTDP-4-amino-4,6-dideoxygalactose transaminase
VLTTPLTAFATTLAIFRVGAVPVWVDVNESGGLDLDEAGRELKADPTIRALLPVHLYGHPLDPDALANLADQRGVALIEDCAQSAGATRNGRPTGTIGLAGATSFYPTKNLGAYGDGGALLTDDGRVAGRARVLRNYGQDGRYHHVEVGLNSRLDELHAAILRSALLPRLDNWLGRRKEIAETYRAALSGSSLEPILPTGGESANHLFPVLVAEGAIDIATERMTEASVDIGRHYPVLCPDQPACANAGIVRGDLANAHHIAERVISLPLNPYLSDRELDAVIAAIASL